MISTTTRRAASVLGVLASTALIAVGCGGSSGDGASGAATGSKGLDFVPANSLFYVVFDADFEGDNWQQVDDQLKNFEGYEKGRGDALKEAFSDTNVEYEKDIKPWLGDTVGVAGFNISAADENASDGDFVVWADVEDEGELESFLKRSTEELDSSEYEGTEIVHAQDNESTKDEEEGADADSTEGDDADKDDSFYHATKDGVFLFGEKETAVKDALKANADGETLSDDDALKDVAGEVGEDTVAALVLSGDAVRDLVTEAGKQDKEAAEAIKTVQGLKQYEAFEGLALGFGGEDEGLRLHGFIGYDGDKLGDEELGNNFQPALLEGLPESAVVGLAAHDLGGQLEKTVNSLSDGNDQVAGMIAQGEGVLGVKVEDIGEALSGEHALGLGAGAGAVPSVWFVTENEGDTTTDVLTKLLGASALAGGDPPKDVTVGGVTGKQTSVSGIPITAAKVGENTIVTNDEEFLGSFGDGDTLGDSEAYTDVTGAADVPDEVAGLFFVDVQKALAFGKSLGADTGDEDLSALGSVVAWGENDEESQTFDLFLKINEGGGEGGGE